PVMVGSRDRRQRTVCVRAIPCVSSAKSLFNERGQFRRNKPVFIYACRRRKRFGRRNRGVVEICLFDERRVYVVETWLLPLFLSIPDRHDKRFLCPDNEFVEPAGNAAQRCFYKRFLPRKD